MTHKSFQPLLETHVMGDVALVDKDNKIGVISSEGVSLGLNEVIANFVDFVDFVDSIDFSIFLEAID